MVAPPGFFIFTMLILIGSKSEHYSKVTSDLLITKTQWLGILPFPQYIDRPVVSSWRWSNHIVKSCFIHRSLWCWTETPISMTLNAGHILCSSRAWLMSIKLPTKNMYMYGPQCFWGTYVYTSLTLYTKELISLKKSIKPDFPMCWFYFII